MLNSKISVAVLAFATLSFHDAVVSSSYAQSNSPNAAEAMTAKAQELEKERIAALGKVVALNKELRDRGVVGGSSGAAASFTNEMYQVESAWPNAQLSLCKTDAERVAVHTQWLMLAKEHEEYYSKGFKGGIVREQTVLMAKSNRLGAEIELERAKAKAGGKSIPVGDAKDARIKKLAQEQVESLRKLIALEKELRDRGVVGPSSDGLNLRALMTAELALCENDKERIAVIEKVLALAKEHEKYFTNRVAGGIAREQSVLLAKATRLEFEIELEKAKAKAAVQPK